MNIAIRGPRLNIAIPIFDDITALDAVGPYEVLSRLPHATVSFIAAERGGKRTENKMLALHADLALDELTDPDVIVMPGGFGTRALTTDKAMLGLGAPRSPDVAMDHVGVHRFARARGRRDPRGS